MRIQVLPFKEQILLISQKVKGIIKSSRELQDKVWALKQVLNLRSKSDREVRASQGCFILGKTSLKVKLKDIENATPTQQQDLVKTLKDLIKQIEEKSSKEKSGSRDNNPSFVKSPRQEILS